MSTKFDTLSTSRPPRAADAAGMARQAAGAIVGSMRTVVGAVRAGQRGTEIALS
jgi:hypothetical protein